MSDVTVARIPGRGMVTLRGEMSALAGAVEAALGLGLPGQGRIVAGEGRAAAWMSPDELLLLMPEAEVPAALSASAAALGGVPHLAVDVSDARSLFAVEGPGLRDVLQKLTPADLSPAAFPPGMIRRTRLAQVAGALWLTGEARAEAICFRSVTEYVETLLTTAAGAGPVGFHAPV